MKKILLLLALFLHFASSAVWAQCCVLGPNDCFPTTIAGACSFQGGTFVGTNCSDTPGCQQVLPVDFIYFLSSQDEKGVELAWLTAMELNNEGFEVQVSADAKEWKEVGFVYGQGTVEEEYIYNFTVAGEQLYKGVNYFRLKQMDFDGQYEFSNIVAEVWADKEVGMFLSPNPAYDRVAVAFGEDFTQNETITYTVNDLLGREVLRGALTGDQIQVLDIAALKAGSYILTVEVGQRTSTARFVKQK